MKSKEKEELISKDEAVMVIEAMLGGKAGLLDDYTLMCAATAIKNLKSRSTQEEG